VPQDRLALLVGHPVDLFNSVVRSPNELRGDAVTDDLQEPNGGHGVA
jgi:hypothetical protein